MSGAPYVTREYYDMIGIYVRKGNLNIKFTLFCTDSISQSVFDVFLLKSGESMYYYFFTSSYFDLNVRDISLGSI